MLKTISWEKGKVRLIDQTKLPLKLAYKTYSNYKGLARAIKKMEVRGAPALGIAAALGVLLSIQNSKARDYKGFSRELKRVISHLSRSRPTAVNLFWALERMRARLSKNRRKSISRMKEALFSEAFEIIAEDENANRKMGEQGARLIKNGDSILTHCNAGGLATGGYGTALGVILTSHKQGKRITVYAEETRPLCQGARLTCWELKRAGVEVTLICDSMAAEVMREGRVNKVLVGADRIAANGDTANKIGTYSLAVLAREHRIPFYVACPTSTLDLNLRKGEEIPIEERDAREVTEFRGKRIAPRGIKVFNPAFDITPAKYITAIITEKGIARPPYRISLKKLSS
jgi:methylthioribose-1-phosphate isomerase